MQICTIHVPVQTIRVRVRRRTTDLFNESFLDINGDGMPEEIDTACADIPIITHVKSLGGDPLLGPDGNYKVTYEVTVTNEGAADGVSTVCLIPSVTTRMYG